MFAYGTTDANDMAIGDSYKELIWEFETGDMGWAPYDLNASSIIEMHHAMYRDQELAAERNETAADRATEASTCTLNTNGFTYSIDFKRMTQTSHTANQTRAIRRLADVASANGGDRQTGIRARSTPGLQRPLEEVKEWAGYPSRQCPHPGCQGKPPIYSCTSSGRGHHTTTFLLTTL